MANRVVHFEIEALDTERAKKFYSQAFGWEMQQQGGEYGEYVVVVTGDSKEPGGINGGLYKASDKKEVNAYRCVIAVDDINKAMSDVKDAGGKVFGEPANIPMVGLFVSCEDTEENKFTLLQPSPDMMPKN
ncbi:MAG TPA: VOC family protein [Candidatus Saccharimonadales bacterium]|nr:VOC family protein [Candidatus Saccharimonadales bacterium]